MRRVARKTDTIYLTAEECEWVKRKWSLIRKSHTTADEALSTWRRLSAEIDDYLARKNVTDVLEKSRYRSESIALKNAFGESTWFRGEAQAHASDVSLFLRLKELGLL